MNALPLLLPLSLLSAAPAFAAPAPAACPGVAEQLGESLASAMQRIGAEGVVRVEFEVGPGGRARPIDLDGTRRYLTPVRIAVDSLECRAGAPQRYVLDIRFAHPAPRALAAAASITLAQARPAPPDAPR